MWAVRNKLYLQWQSKVTKFSVLHRMFDLPLSSWNESRERGCALTLLHAVYAFLLVNCTDCTEQHMLTQWESHSDFQELSWWYAAEHLISPFRIYMFCLITGENICICDWSRGKLKPCHTIQYLISQCLFLCAGRRSAIICLLSVLKTHPAHTLDAVHRNIWRRWDHWERKKSKSWRGK